MIEFAGVSKTYRSLTGRAVDAVVDFSLTIAEGEVIGLAGPNGAGKSTLIALLLGFLRPTSGSVTVHGMAPRVFVERHGMGYLSELVAIPPAWRTENALRRYALLAGIEPHRVQERVDVVIAMLGLDEHRRKLIKQLSKGNLQRVGLAQALLHDERVLILDEPTHGLDPMWTQRFRDLVGELRRPDRAIFIASHNLDELQRISDRVAIIDRGRLQRVVDLKAEPAAAAHAPYRIVVAAGAEYVAQVFPDAAPAGLGEFDIPQRSLETLNRQLAELLGRGALVVSVAPVHTALEQQFREAVAQ
ncbi:MAG TPA: ABC transporter ATP-binding protein [Gemmatimonadaceae bacterium]|nr:ABC transporter ATP-binding protein [Gemmatimonadaceae bacterium]